VLAVEENGEYRQSANISQSCTTQLNPVWNLDRLDQDRLPLDRRYNWPQLSNFVEVFVVDSGVRITHREFSGRASWGINTIDNENIDGSNHGTHVAGTVAGTTFGVCKHCRVVAVKVLDRRGIGTLVSILAGLQWISSNIKPEAVSVINLSLGGAASVALDDAVNSFADRNVFVTVAAGNDNWDACTNSPGRAERVLTVANSMLLISQDFRTGGTNWGRCVNLWAPGNDIRSASSSSDTADFIESGTSMSAPHVAGVLANYASQMAGATRAVVEQRLFADALRGVIGDALESRGTPNILLRQRCPF
jgi:subtilisin family serine protease